MTICKECGCRMQPQRPPAPEVKLYRVCPQCGEDYAEFHEVPFDHASIVYHDNGTQEESYQ